jgi:hypothetical protein
MRIPDWAPKDLVEQLPQMEEDARRSEADGDDSRNFLYGDLSDSEALDILKRLITDKRMEDTWRLLARREPSYRRDSRILGDELKDLPPTPYSLSLCFACFEAIGQWRSYPKLTRAEERDLHLAIAKKAGELRKLLQTDPGWVHTQWSFYPDEFADLGRKFGIKTLTGNAGSYFDGPGQLPRLDQFIERLEKNAQQMSVRPWAVAQPKAPEAHIRFAALFLSDHFVGCYGTPLNSIVATVTNVILDADITEDHVRAWIRTRKKQGPQREEIDG